ncbi:MAG TPA: 4-hydroxy-tetrahydrodipicolinate reductase, partial [Nitrospira sp.]
MIKVVVAGAAGRMGCRLVALVRDSTALTLAGALEGSGHHAIGDDAGETSGTGRAGVPITSDLAVLMDRGEVVIDFSAPEATLEHFRIVAQHHRAMVI